MTQTDQLLESIRQQEFQNLHFFNRFLGFSRITKTSRIATTIRFDQDSKTFKPDNISKSIVAGVLLLIGIVMIYGVFPGKKPDAGAIAAICVLICIFGFNGVKELVIDSHLNFSITVDRQGISINDTIFNWSRIQDTAILHLPIGKGGKKYLVILLTDNNYEIWDLSHFMSFPTNFSDKLASYIEYFKSRK
jgi:hypothetical protein